MRVRSILNARQPDAAFSMGGYVAGPVMLAAWMRKLPAVAMEPNAVPGFTNRRMAKFVSRALVNFPETVQYFPEGRAEVSGMPVREEFFLIPPRTPFENAPFTVLITGGSRGSRRLNEASRDSWPMFAMASRTVCIIHQTGNDAFEALQSEFQKRGVKGEITPFLSDMPAAFAKADLIICRSGASTVAEVAAAGKPAILVPFPYAADDHQLRNAEALARAGAARLVLDHEITGKRLYDEVNHLISNVGALRDMGEKARAFAKPKAAQRAADVLEELAAQTAGLVR